MANLLKAENIKLRRKHIFLAAFAMVNLELLWLAFAMFFNDNTYIKNGYATFLYQLPMLNALFFPVIIGVAVSRICDLEHKGNTLKALFTMQKKSSLFIVKFIVIAKLAFLLALYQIIFIIILGKVSGFEDAFYSEDFFVFFISQSTASIFIVLAFLALALKFKNQFITFIFGIIIGFLGFLSSFFPPVIMRIIPSSYFMLLGTVGMNWDIETRIVSYYYRAFAWRDLSLLLVLIALLFAISISFFKRKEV